MGIKKPTIIQQQCIPAVLAGTPITAAAACFTSFSSCPCEHHYHHVVIIDDNIGSDVMGRAKTGSGKTAAFALPILQKFASDPFGIFAIVLTPTRYATYHMKYHTIA